MPTEIEKGYEEQGYKLPEGWTWERVAALREKWDVGAIYVPEAVDGGVVGWGVPVVDGKFLKHP